MPDALREMHLGGSPWGSPTLTTQNRRHCHQSTRGACMRLRAATLPVHVIIFMHLRPLFVSMHVRSDGGLHRGKGFLQQVEAHLARSDLWNEVYVERIVIEVAHCEILIINSKPCCNDARSCMLGAVVSHAKPWHGVAMLSKGPRPHTGSDSTLLRRHSFAIKLRKLMAQISQNT